MSRTRPSAGRTIVLSLALLCGAAAVGQQKDIPLQRDIYLDLDRNHARIDTSGSGAVHTSMRPYLESRADTNGVMGYRPDNRKHYYWITEKLFTEHLFDIREKDFRLIIDPVFRFELGQDFRDPSEFADTTRFYHNARGFRIAGDLGRNFSFQTTFYENQAIFPQYLYLYAQRTGVVPGQGRIKGFKNRAFDFAWATGSISWTPARWLNIQFGNGKHFVGNGYRSVLLSNNAFNYPYLKFSFLSTDQRWQYTTFHAKLTELQRLPTGDANESLFYWKRMRVNHLSYDLGRVQLGLFESTIFRNVDSSGVQPFDPLELNPVIGLNTIINGTDGRYQNLLGLDAKFKLCDKAFAYGQFALDDLSQQRYAWQFGARFFDVFLKDLHVQVEYNSISPHTYQHVPAAMAHTHYGQPLAHPMGAYVNEAVGIVDYRYKKLFLARAKLNLATYHLDGADTLNYGGDPFKPNVVVQGTDGPLIRQLTYVDLSISWLMNQMTNMQLTLGWYGRDLTNAPAQLNSSYLYLVWSTNLFDRYYDI